MDEEKLTTVRRRNTHLLPDRFLFSTFLRKVINDTIDISTMCPLFTGHVNKVWKSHGAYIDKLIAEKGTDLASPSKLSKDANSKKRKRSKFVFSMLLEILVCWVCQLKMRTV